MKSLLKISLIIQLINLSWANDWSLLVSNDKMIKIHHTKLGSSRFELNLEIPQIKCLISEIGKDKLQNETRMIVCNHLNEKNQMLYQTKNLASCLEINNKTSYAITPTASNTSILINLECKK